MGPRHIKVHGKMLMRSLDMCVYKVDIVFMK